MSASYQWVETEYRDNLMARVQEILQCKGTGQLVLNLGQGGISSVVWREKITLDTKSLDTRRHTGVTVTP